MSRDAERRRRLVEAMFRARENARRRRSLLLSNLHLVDSHHPEVTDVDRAMMDRAIELAAKAAESGEVPVGAVLYRNDEIIAQAANNREATSDPTGHAEMIAIRQAGERLGTWRLNDCSLAVTLEPCPMCAGAMVNARLGRLIYGTTDPKAGACHSLFAIPTDPRLNHRVRVIGGIEAIRCRELLTTFFRMRRKDRQSGRSDRAGPN
jgi:tRNA(adenine34) deaminase